MTSVPEPDYPGLISQGPNRRPDPLTGDKHYDRCEQQFRDGMTELGWILDRDAEPSRGALIVYWGIRSGGFSGHEIRFAVLAGIIDDTLIIQTEARRSYITRNAFIGVVRPSPPYPPPPIQDT